MIQAVFSGGTARPPGIRCLEMVEVVTEWMEDAVGDDSRAAIEAHLAICPYCVAYVDQLRTTRALAARLPVAEDPAPAGVKARLLAAFRASRPG